MSQARGCLGKQISNVDVARSDINFRINTGMKNRSDYLKLALTYDWNSAWRKVNYILIYQLTDKQYLKVEAISSSKIEDKIAAIKKVTKSNKILDHLFYVEQFVEKTRFFRDNVNPNFGYNGDFNKYKYKNLIRIK